MDGQYRLMNVMQKEAERDLGHRAQQALERSDSFTEALGDDFLAGAVKTWNHVLECLAMNLHAEMPRRFSVLELVRAAAED